MDKICAYFAQPRKLQVFKVDGGCVNLILLYVSEVFLESNNWWLWHWQCESSGQYL